jgi:hypothetical protein
VLPKELFTDASLKKPMPFSAKPSPEVQLIAHELALLRGLAADRRQASWLAALRKATHVRRLLEANRPSGSAQFPNRRPPPAALVPAVTDPASQPNLPVVAP